VINKPFVSIILPTYNRAHLLPRAVESVLSQTFPEWELIIWNDGSTDETVKILDAYHDPRIRTFSASNQGKSAALNQALKQANADIFAFLDDDDCWMPEFLERQMAILRAQPELDLVFGNFRNVNVARNLEEDGFRQNAPGLNRLRTEELGGGAKHITEGFLEGISTENFIAFDTVLVRKRLTERVGPFNTNLNGGEDFEFWWRAGLQGLQAAFTEEIGLIRYKYPGSLSGSEVTTRLNFLRTLDACAEASRQAGKPETIELLRPAYRNTWQNMISISAQQNDLNGAFVAFRTSLKYGFRLGSIRLLLRALLTRS
jgi:glycosyltransferase involved in cell wall biosynthesis